MQIRSTSAQSDHGDKMIGQLVAAKMSVKKSNTNEYFVIQDCNSKNKISWSNNNALSCSDGNLCTRGDHCVNGVCKGTPFTCRSCETCDGTWCQIKPGFCVINRTCYRQGHIKSGNTCQVCWVITTYVFVLSQ